MNFPSTNLSFWWSHVLLLLQRLSYVNYMVPKLYNKILSYNFVSRRVTTYSTQSQVMYIEVCKK